MIAALLGVDICPTSILAVRLIGVFHATSYPSPDAEGLEFEYYLRKVLAQISKRETSKVL